LQITQGDTPGRPPLPLSLPSLQNQLLAFVL
jgi:hypothetical protein